MIRDYAVEPCLFAAWDRCKFLVSHFGLAKGRLISRYPSKWKAQVQESLNIAERDGSLRPVDRTRIVEKLRGIEASMAVRAPQWDERMDWLANAELEDRRDPFFAILASTNPRERTNVLTYDETEDDSPLWAQEHEKVCPRTAEAFAAAVAPLVRFSSAVVFVDPYFDPFKAPILRTVKAVLAGCLQRSNGRPLDRIEFHTLHREEIQGFHQECASRLPRIIPQGLVLRVVRWRVRAGGDGIHNRHVLTDRGGVRFPWGLAGEGEHQTDDLTLMAHSTYSHRWNQFCGGAPAFDLVDESSHTGTMK